MIQQVLNTPARANPLFMDFIISNNPITFSTTILLPSKDPLLKFCETNWSSWDESAIPKETVQVRQ